MTHKRLSLIFLITIAVACDKKEKVNPADAHYETSANFRVIADSNSYGRALITFEMEDWLSCSIDFGDGSQEEYPYLYNPHTIAVESGTGIEHTYRNNGEYTITLTALGLSPSGKQTSVSQVKKIQISNIPPKAVADFSYEILDNGVVKFTNLSQNAADYEWRGSSPYYSKDKNPTFIFEKNGTYSISLNTHSPFHESTKSVNINITNVKEDQAPTFTGTFLNMQGTFKGIGHVRYDGACCDGIPLGIPFFNFTVPNTNISLLLITSSLVLKGYTLEDKYKAMKENFSVGAKILSYPGWGSFISLGTPTEPYAQKTLEVTEIQEISQSKLTPEMYNKAFWVTFKIKGDYGQYGKIDGLLKLKYLIY